MSRKRRHLVARTDTARHPFRQSLPPHVTGAKAVSMAGLRGAVVTSVDLRSFLAAYVAFFSATMLFLI